MQPYIHPKTRTARRTLHYSILIVFVLLQAPSHATFPGENGLIAFHNGSIGGIYTIKPDGSRRRKLAADGLEPAWAPNGKRIVYARFRLRAGTPSNELVIMRANGRGKRTIVRDPAMYLGEPHWSPDGSRILYRRGPARSTGGDLYTIRLDGSDIQLLTTDGENPDWSVSSSSAPLGRIAFVAPGAFPCSGGLQTYVMNLDGTGRSLIPPSGCNVTFFPSWNPNGTQLAVASYTNGLVPDLTDIYVANTDPSRTRLTDLPGYDWEPAWSPQGDRIVFANSQGSSSALYLVDPANPFAATLIPHTTDVHAGRPDWQPR